MQIKAWILNGNNSWIQSGTTLSQSIVIQSKWTQIIQSHSQTITISERHHRKQTFLPADNVSWVLVLNDPTHAVCFATPLTVVQFFICAKRGRQKDTHPSRPLRTGRFRGAWWVAATPVGSPTRLWFWRTSQLDAACLCGTARSGGSTALQPWLDWPYNLNLKAY